jgi:DNA primase
VPERQHIFRLLPLGVSFHLFSKNYVDYFAGRIVFPIYDADASPTGLIGRRPGDRGVRWLKQQTREIALTTKSWLYGWMEQDLPRLQYRT